MKKYQQRDIVYASFNTDQKGNPLPHLALIISNEDVFNAEGLYHCLMISTKLTLGADFAYQISPSMVTTKLDNPESYVKVQMLALFEPKEIIRRISAVKKSHFEDILRFMNQQVFSFECS